MNKVHWLVDDSFSFFFVVLIYLDFPNFMKEKNPSCH